MVSKYLDAPARPFVNEPLKVSRCFSASEWSSLKIIPFAWFVSGENTK